MNMLTAWMSIFKVLVHYVTMKTVHFKNISKSIYVTLFQKHPEIDAGYGLNLDGAECFDFLCPAL